MTALLGPESWGRLGWYARRLRAMSPAEIGWRVHDRACQEVWARRRFGRVPDAGRPSRSNRTGALPPARTGADALSDVPASAREAVCCVADRLLAGEWPVLGTMRRDMVDPTWALDPVSGLRYPEDRPASRIDFRSPSDRRDVKQVWELSRHHHLTLLACAWRLAGDDRYAEMAARHLRSWWERNPPYRGVNWASGIEVGIRLISWVWVRRLLDGWAGAPALFEENPLARHQLYWHQRYLHAFRSRGSSANNHVVAEAAGLLVASAALPWFAESARWRAESAALLEEQLARNTFPTGINREQAFEYHGLVTELGLVAAAEASAAGVPLSGATSELLCRMVDGVAAVLDQSGGAPRYGDADDGRALVVDDPAANRWSSLLAVGAAVFGPLPWWPTVVGCVTGALVGGLVGAPMPVAGRPALRPSHFADAGLTLLRSPAGTAEEIWCRCDGGPHGFLSIGAHAHADALSLELRHDGVPILVDPGTYCYHREPAWRGYFRSTVAHNTVELDGQDQSVSGGPFLWVRGAGTTLLDVAVDRPGVQRWSAEHDGYLRLAPPARHRRTVSLDTTERCLRIDDQLWSDGRHGVRMAFHLGPSVAVRLEGGFATLRWARADGGPVTATMALPSQLQWSVHRGSTDPVLGWYSPGYGRKEPVTCLIGRGQVATAHLATEVQLIAGAVTGPDGGRRAEQGDAVEEAAPPPAQGTRDGMEGCPAR